MKQSFHVQLIVEEEDLREVPGIENYYPEYFSYAMLTDILSNAGFDVELVTSPGCKSGTVLYLKRKSDVKGD